MAFEWLEDKGTELAETVGRRLSARPGSSFAAIGEASCQRQAAAAIAALRADLLAGQLEALRRAVQALVEELLPHGLRFADLRFYVQTLRGAVLNALEEADAAARPGVEA